MPLLCSSLEFIAHKFMAALLINYKNDTPLAVASIDKFMLQHVECEQLMSHQNTSPTTAVNSKSTLN